MKETILMYMFEGATSFNQDLSKWDPNLEGRGTCFAFADDTPCKPDCGLPEYESCK